MGALALEVGDQVLVEVVGGHDQGVVEAGVGEHAVGRLAEAGQVARIEADGGARTRRPAARSSWKAVRALGSPGGQGVVGVHQQEAALGIEAGVGAEGLKLVVEAHDPGVGVGAAHRDAEELAGQHVRRGMSAPPM